VGTYKVKPHPCGGGYSIRKDLATGWGMLQDQDNEHTGEKKKKKKKKKKKEKGKMKKKTGAVRGKRRQGRWTGGGAGERGCRKVYR
jgi:hypothetical protein